MSHSPFFKIELNVSTQAVMWRQTSPPCSLQTASSLMQQQLLELLWKHSWKVSCRLGSELTITANIVFVTFWMKPQTRRPPALNGNVESIFPTVIGYLRGYLSSFYSLFLLSTHYKNKSMTQLRLSVQTAKTTVQLCAFRLIYQTEVNSSKFEWGRSFYASKIVGKKKYTWESHFG